MTKKDKDVMTTGTWGTPAYMAPEIITRKGKDFWPRDLIAADMWSLGITLY